MGLVLARAIWVCVAMVLAGCGSRQSVSTITVTSVGAGVPSETYEEIELPFEVAEAGPPRDMAKSRLEELPRRDIKMTSYEEAMSRPVEMGDVTLHGEETQLTGEEVARVMDQHLDEMYEQCIQKELARGNPLGVVTIDLAIRGTDGMILGATIEPGRRRFKKCLAGYLEDVRFPEFGSPRMGARYRFHAG